jgi:5-methylcytosine-specific restriction endonuclease McrA
MASITFSERYRRKVARWQAESAAKEAKRLEQNENRATLTAADKRKLTRKEEITAARRYLDKIRDDVFEMRAFHAYRKLKYASKSRSQSELCAYKPFKEWLRVKTNICEYCERTVDWDKVSIDHSQPLSRGGNNTLENLRVACWPCNKLKFDATEAEFRLLTTPKQLKKYHLARI